MGEVTRLDSVNTTKIQIAARYSIIQNGRDTRDECADKVHVDCFMDEVLCLRKEGRDMREHSP